MHWTPSTGVTSGLFGYNTIAFGAGHWVAGTNTSTAIFSSTDATTWTPQNDVAHNLRIVFGRDMFVGNSGDGLFTSADGTQFTKKATTGLVNGGIGYFSGGRFLFLSQLLEPPYTNQKVDVSTDGVTYTEFGKIEGHPGPAVYDVAFGKCRYVIAGWWLSGNDYKPYIVSRAAAPAP